MTRKTTSAQRRSGPPVGHSESKLHSACLSSARVGAPASPLYGKTYGVFYPIIHSAEYLLSTD